MSIESHSSMPSGNSSSENTPENDSFSGGGVPPDGGCGDVVDNGFGWDLLRSTVRADWTATGLEAWIEADLDALELELSEFSTPNAIVIRRN